MRHVVMILVTWVAVIACAGPGGPSPTSGPTPVASPLQTTAPTSASAATPSAAPTAAGLAVDSIANVVGGPLRIRSKPSTASDSVKYPETLPNGEKLYLIAGPTPGSDYDWYLVQPLDPMWPAGWVAAADHDGAPWLLPAQITCPSGTALESVAALSPAARLFCYGPRDFAVSGMIDVDVLACGDPSPRWESADWFNPVCSFWTIAASQADAILQFVVPPDIGSPLVRLDSRQRVAGAVVVHLDDERAKGCKGGDDLAPDEVGYPELPHPDAVVFLCRTMFVASSVSVLGAPQ